MESEISQQQILDSYNETTDVASFRLCAKIILMFRQLFSTEERALPATGE